MNSRKDMMFNKNISNVNLYSLLRDILKSLYAVILGTLAVVMLVSIVTSTDYQRSYTTSTTFVVHTRSASTSVYNNLSAAQTMATNFSNILNSDILKKQVCKDLGLESFDATASAEVIEETNLLTLTVTADTPRKAYDIIHSIMDNYENITQYVTEDMIMQVLKDPEVPTNVDLINSANTKIKQFGAVAFVGLIVLFGIVSFLKTTIKSESDMKEQLVSQSLGMIYFERKGVGRKKKNSLLTSHVSASFDYVERYHKLTSAFLHAAEKEQAQIVTIASVEEKEGKTLLVTNLAMTLARQDKKVLIIDGNLRKPQIGAIFGLQLGEADGLSAFLRGQTSINDVLKRDRKTGVYFLPSYGKCEDSVDLLSQGEFRKLLKVLRKHFDYILIDTPAMKGRADAEIIAAASDMSILTVKYDYVRAADLNDAIDALQGSQDLAVYSVLNMVKTMPGERRVVGSYGGYGRYGRYGNYSQYNRYGKYGRYGRYGSYGRYGRYGNYGRYGAYGHYGLDAEKADADDKNALKETLGKSRGGEDA